MKNLNIIPAVEIIGAMASGLDVFIDQVNSSKGLVAYTINSRVMISSENQESDGLLSDLLEENAFILGLDNTFVKLVYLNLETNEILESNLAITEFKREYLADLNDLDEIPLSASTELVEFIHEYEDSIQDEVNQLDKVGNVSQPHDEHVAAPTSDDESLLEPDEDEFEDNVDFDASNDEEVETDYGTNETNSEFNLTEQLEGVLNESISEDNENDQVYPVKINHKEKVVVPNSDIDDAQPHLESNIEGKTIYGNELFLKAVSIFNENIAEELPEFDVLTHRELQQEVVQANFELERVKKETIQAIYNHLQQEKQELEDDLEEQIIEPAKQRHDATIEKLKRNLELQINRLQDEKENEYQADRERYVQSQLPVIRKKFDSEYLKEHNVAVQASIDAINEDINKSIINETEQYKKYVQNILEKQQEELFSNLSFDQELDHYKNSFAKQKSYLIKQAEKFETQVEEAIRETKQEASAILQKNKQLEEKFEIQKDTENQRIEAKAAEIISNKTRELDEINLKWRNENTELQKKLEKTLREKETLSDSLGQANTRLNYLETQIKSNPVPVQAPVQTVASNSPSEDANKAKLRVPAWMAATLAALVTIIVLMSANMFMGNSESRNTQAQEVLTTQTSIISDNESKNSQSDEGLHAGEEIPYTTKDGKQVTVIVDNAKSGHYVDKDGTYKSVIFAK